MPAAVLHGPHDVRLTNMTDPTPQAGEVRSLPLLRMLQCRSKASRLALVPRGLDVPWDRA